MSNNYDILEGLRAKSDPEIRGHAYSLALGCVEACMGQKRYGKLLREMVDFIEAQNDQLRDAGAFDSPNVVRLASPESQRRVAAGKAQIIQARAPLLEEIRRRLERLDAVAGR